MEPKPIVISIRENSSLARMGARKLKSPRCAMVIRRTIHLWGISRADFLSNRPYVRHEIQHVLQYRRMGTAGFLFRYLLYSLRRGYYLNPLEVEARNAEAEPMPQGIYLSGENAPLA